METAVQTSVAETKREGEMGDDSLGAISGQLSNPDQDFNSSRTTDLGYKKILWAP